VARELHDHYFKQAKRDGYRSRAAYKLIEIDDRKSIIARGNRVLDCGAAPGSWIQVAAERVGPRGRIVGIDLQPLDHGLASDAVTILTGDLQAVPAADLLAPLGGGRFDVVLSDMAPSTTGDRTIDHHGSVRLCHAVLDRCRDVLADGGNLVMKVLEGEAYPDLLARTRKAFEKTKGFKPKASRGDSTEMYVVAHGYRGTAADPAVEDALPRRKPSTGWGS
jgi:23S rRNA (uridine2552-2'-O)-methyltransferase